MLGWLRQRQASNPRWFWTLAFVLWLCVVWGHSLMGGEISSFESSRFLFLVRPLFNLFGNNDEVLMTFVIRKTAHFSEYAILVALARRMSFTWSNRLAVQLALTLVVLVCAPCIDESIQLLVPGRAGQVRDVFIDMSGGLFGLLAFEVVRHIRRR